MATGPGRDPQRSKSAKNPAQEVRGGGWGDGGGAACGMGGAEGRGVGHNSARHAFNSCMQHPRENTNVLNSETIKASALWALANTISENK